jgi:hypothetical protein
LVHHPQKVENWETPQNNKCEDGQPPLWLTYIGEKGRTLGKGYRINEVILGTPLGNVMGT